MELATTTPFTPWASLAGGVLIGISAVMVMAIFGRIAGISGITTGGVLAGSAGDRSWRIAFIAGLVAAPLAASLFGSPVVQTVPGNLVGMAVAGLAVGAGTVLGSGCTSGHGVCGLARLSTRSLAAVATFMTVAVVTVFVLRHVVGGLNMRAVLGFACGLVFGLGLVISGMSDPAKVLNFLDLAGVWDPSLAFVMGGASLTAFAGYRLVWGRPQPILATTFEIPTNTAIDAPLLTGAALFGLGWGIGGFCPGPAWTALPLMAPGTLVFVPAMLAGMWLARRLRAPPAPVAA